MAGQDGCILANPCNYWKTEEAADATDDEIHEVNSKNIACGQFRKVNEIKEYRKTKSVVMVEVEQSEKTR